MMNPYVFARPVGSEMAARRVVNRKGSHDATLGTLAAGRFRPALNHAQVRQFAGVYFDTIVAPFVAPLIAVLPSA